tara:strand:- start:2369 stop:2926 length:558 start_codon:yes stop_codon:yes gene_type:complete
MKIKNILLATVLVVGTTISGIAQEDKLTNKTGHIEFYSHTEVEDLKADNDQVTSAITKSTGKVVFVVPMQSFEFKKSLMQKHFNKEKFLNTKAFPKAKFVGKLDDLSAVDFAKDGTYNVRVSGDLTIKGKTNKIQVKGTITVADGKVTVETEFSIVLADYDVLFEKGKPSKNIAKSVKITTKVAY